MGYEPPYVNNQTLGWAREVPKTIGYEELQMLVIDVGINKIGKTTLVMRRWCGLDEHNYQGGIITWLRWCWTIDGDILNV